MRYNEIINEDTKRLNITSIRNLATMLSYGEITRNIYIEIQEEYKIDFPPNFKVNGNMIIYEGGLIKMSGDLNVNGNFDFYNIIYNTDLSKLNLKTKGSVDIKSFVTTFPKTLIVGNNLYLTYTKITKLPNNLKVTGDLVLTSTHLDKLPNTTQVEGKIIQDGMIIR